MDRKRCFQVPYELVDNLNVTYSNTNGMLAFWNKYQIFLMNKIELDRHIQQEFQTFFSYTDFEIHQLILAEHLLCLDIEGSLYIGLVHYPNLVQNSSARTKPKPGFQRLEENILCIELHENLLFSIKLEQDELLLRIHKIIINDMSVQLNRHCMFNCNEIAIKTAVQPSELKREKCILYCCRIENQDVERVNEIFSREVNDLQYKHFIIIVSFDKLTLHAFLVGLQLKLWGPVKLLTCPSEINQVLILKENGLNLLIGLHGGTIIKYPLNNNIKSPMVAHLNTAIQRFTILDDKIIYTDGMTMWISTDTFSESDASLRQFFVKNVKDFTIIDDKITCTTYSKLVYAFNAKEESSYLVPLAESEYYSSEHLLNNIDYLNSIMEEIEKNEKIIKNMKREEDHITALALSIRQDVMHQIIQYHLSVYEKYEDIHKKDLALHLTNNLEDYFKRGAFCFLIELSADLHQNFSEILSNIFTDSKIYITISSQGKIIKTLNVKITDSLTILNIAIPVNINKLNITNEVSCNIKIVKKIPKVVNCKDNLWTVIYCKEITLTPEHFIQTNSQNNVHLLKDPEDSVENLLYKSAYKHHGHLFRINKSSEDLFTWSFYVKVLPTYKEILGDEFLYKNHFSCSTKAKFLLKGVSSEEFLNSRKNFSLLVFNEKVDMEVINNDISSNPSHKMIKVSCADPTVALGIRNFFSNLIHQNVQGKIFLSCSKLISSLENTEKAVKKCLEDRLQFEEFFKIYEQFQITLCETLI